MGVAESGCWWSLKVSELSDTSRIPVAFAGVVLVSGAALCPFTADCIQHSFLSAQTGWVNVPQITVATEIKLVNCLLQLRTFGRG
jgi:hypothetical protein